MPTVDSPGSYYYDYTNWSPVTGGGSCWSLKAVMLAVVLLFSFPVSAEEKNKCEAKYAFYDEAHLAYDAAFATEYGLPEENIMEMPEDLRFIEMIIRTENGKPTCRMNMAIKDDPKYAFPKDDIHIKRFESSAINIYPLNKNWVKTPRIEYGYLQDMQSRFPDMKENLPDDRRFLWEGGRVILIHNVVVRKGSTLFSGEVPCTQPLQRDARDDLVLQVEKSNPSGTYQEVRSSAKQPWLFFEPVYLPKEWVKQVESIIKAISEIHDEESHCRVKNNPSNQHKEY